MAHVDPVEELSTLVAALRAHLDLAAAAGTSGLPAADAALVAARGGPGVDPGPEPPAPAQRPVAAPPSRPGTPGRGAPTPEQAARPPAAEAVRPATAAAPPPGGAGKPDAPRAASASVGPTPAARERLTVLAEEVSGCTRCALHAERKQAVFSRGTGSSGLCFVGEGPGADEDEQGAPFVGKAGQLLDRMIAAMGFDRDEVYVCNVVKCRPPKNRKPEADEMGACRPYLTEQLELVDPKVIVALGATAVEGLLGVTGGITRLRGNWRLYRGRIAVMPTFHPAYLLRQPEAKRVVWQDLQEVVKHLGRTLPQKPG